MDEYLKDLYEIREHFEGRGIRTANTRIERYCECLDQIILGRYHDAPKVFDRYPTESFAEFGECLLYVLREVHELTWIIKGLKMNDPMGVEVNLKEIVSGTDFATLDVDTSSRNTQFELRIASYFCQAGCNVDLSRITDFVAIGDKDVYYVECKRVGNQKQLLKRISEGRKQLRERMPKRSLCRTVHGCVAVDVTKVAYPHNGVTWALTNNHSRTNIQRELVKVAGLLQEREVFRGEKGFIHCWLQIHIPMLIFYPKNIGSRFSSYHIFREDLATRERSAIRRFVGLFESVSRGDERELPPKKMRRRRTIAIPAGSLIDFDEELIKEFLACGNVVKRNSDDIVGRMKIGEKEHEFRFFEFELFSAQISDEVRAALSGDYMRAGVVFLGGMKNMREPYLEDGEEEDVEGGDVQDLQIGSGLSDEHT